MAGRCRRVSNGDQVNRIAALAMKRGKSVDFTGTGSGMSLNRKWPIHYKMNRPLIIIAIFGCPWLDSNQHYQSRCHNRHRIAIRRVYQLHHTGVANDEEVNYSPPHFRFRGAVSASDTKARFAARFSYSTSTAASMYAPCAH